VARTDFQRELLAVLAKGRNPNSHFAGGATLNRNNPRLSDDFAIFADDAAILIQSVSDDLKNLTASGYRVDRTFAPDQRPQHFKCIVAKDRRSTSVEWACDTVRRFFPAIQDAEFGWRLRQFDLAINKILALAGRREPRDDIDIVALHRSGLTIASLANAAPGKDAGLTPQLVLDEITRNARFSEDELNSVHSLAPIDAVATKRAFLEGVANARDIFSQISLDAAGTVFISANGKFVATTVAADRSTSVIKRPTSAYGALALPPIGQRPTGRGEG
jgi:hypothetical protein